MGKVTAFDLAIVLAYLIMIMYIGVRYYKKVKSDDDFFTAKRSFGPLILIATVCATTLGGSSMMGRAGLGYTNGIECLMTALPYTIGMFIFRMRWAPLRQQLSSSSIPVPLACLVWSIPM